MNNINKNQKANELMVNAIYKALKRADIPVIKASDDLAEILQLAGLQVAYKKKEAPETVSVSDKKHHQTVISSADGTKILKNIDKLITEYQKDFTTKEKTFIGYTAKAIEAKRDGSGSEYATFITQNNIQLQQSGNEDELRVYKTTLAERHFGGSKGLDEDNNRGLKR